MNWDLRLGCLIRMMKKYYHLDIQDERLSPKFGVWKFIWNQSYFFLSLLGTQIYFFTPITKKKYVKVRVPSSSITISFTNCRIAYWREYSQYHVISHPCHFSINYCVIPDLFSSANSNNFPPFLSIFPPKIPAWPFISPTIIIFWLPKFLVKFSIAGI